MSERAHVCPECDKIVSGEFGHESTCESRADPGGRVRRLILGPASRRKVYGRKA